MTEQLLHDQLAKYYDRIYSFRDYLDEAVRVQNLIMKYLETGGNTLLDVACGTGLHLKHLKDDFSHEPQINRQLHRIRFRAIYSI